ncbi:unnamed protein product [Boreogadus saida]
MAAVEYGECPSIHTSRLARFEYGIRVLEGYFFSPGPNWNVLRTQILSAQYGQYGYWNTATDTPCVGLSQVYGGGFGPHVIIILEFCL